MDTAIRDIHNFWFGPLDADGFCQPSYHSLWFKKSDTTDRTCQQQFGDCVEQLVAESTGKNGIGILPVVGEPLSSPGAYGDDRLFVALQIDDRDSDALDAPERVRRRLGVAQHTLHRVERSVPRLLFLDGRQHRFATARSSACSYDAALKIVAPGTTAVHIACCKPFWCGAFHRWWPCRYTKHASTPNKTHVCNSAEGYKDSQNTA